MDRTTNAMKRYTGKEFTKHLEERGASVPLQTILDFIRRPSADEINEAHSRGATGVRRRHFVRAKYADTGEALCIELDMAYTDADADPLVLKVIEFETEDQYELYRHMASHETPGTIQSN
jgi:hypothetical protein